jgi:hypothetical protein
MTEAVDSGRQLLRHTVATAAYRAGKTLRGAPRTLAELCRRQDANSSEDSCAHGRRV